MNYEEKLRNKMSFGEIFELVKAIVEKHLKLHRAGLTLLLENLPTYVGAYYPEGSNYIVLNKALITKLRNFIKEELEYNSFILMILMHEYLHSLSFYNEKEVRLMVAEIAKKEFGEESLPYEHATSNWLKKYPGLNVPVRTENSFEVIREFDLNSQPYIG
ncbi:MAG: hypothetical protein ACP5SE_03485 [Nitrososphaeria archaeon]